MTRDLSNGIGRLAKIISPPANELNEPAAYCVRNL